MPDQLESKQNLYQFGNGLNDNYYIFNKTQLTTKGTISLKSNHFESFSVDGFTKINVGERNKKSGQDLSVEFLVTDKDFFGIGYIQQVFNSKERKLFYYDLDINNFVNFYFCPNADPLGIPNQEILPVENYGQGVKLLTAKFKTPPFLYRCKPNLAYFNKNAIVSFIPRCDDNVTRCDASVPFDAANTIFVVSLAALSNNEKLNLFINPKQPDNALVYTDKFFDLDDFSINNSEAVVNVTLVNNSTNDLLLTSFFNDTTANNNIYMIELGQLATNNTLAITNLDNGSDLLIRWLNVANSPTTLIYNSAKGKLYDSALKTEINPSFYAVNSTLGTKLFFTGIATKNQTLNIAPQQIRLQKNTPENLTVKIESLKTYHLN